MRRNEFLPFSKPTIGKEEIDEVIDSLKSGWITTGPKTQQFEEDFKKYIGCKYALSLSSATAGLHLSLMALNIGKDDEVITTAMTFAATINQIELRGAKPVFVDIDLDTLQIEATQIELKITPKTKAIIPVHFAGQACDMDMIYKLAREYNLYVIEDAAHSLGTEYKGEKIGQHSQIAVFSFHPIKNMTTGEGGMVVTKDEEIAEKIKLLRFHGISKDAWKRYTAKGATQYEILMPGYKYNFMDIQAGLGIWQLKKLDAFIEARRKQAEYYNEAFRDISEITPLSSVKYAIKHAWHLYIIKLELEKIKVNRNEFISLLKEENIGTGVHFEAIHLQPYYRNTYGYKEGNLPNTEYASARIISLPLYPLLTQKDQQDVVEAIKRILDRIRK